VRWGLWSHDSIVLDEAEYSSTYIRRLSSKYRFRLHGESVLYGDILFRVVTNLEDASRCVFFEDVGRHAEDFDAVITRNDLCIPEDESVCGAECIDGNRGEGFRFVSPDEMLEVGDYWITQKSIVIGNLRLLDQLDVRSFARPIGYKQELASRPENLRDVILPDGYLVLPVDAQLQDRLFLGLWIGPGREIIEYDYYSLGEPPPHMRPHLVGRISVNEMSPSIEASSIGSIKFIKTIRTGDGHQGNFNALILNVHGVMVVSGHLENYGGGVKLGTAIGSFTPMIFEINGCERVVYVSDRLPLNDACDRLAEGLGKMLSACTNIAGAKIYTSAQQTLATDYSHGRRVELCD
jgi:hypothetical protein